MWRRNTDDAANLLLLRPVTGVSLRPHLLWNLPEYELVIYRPVCTIHDTKFMITKPIVTFFFQNLLLDKVTWWLNNKCLFYLTLCFAYCYLRFRHHLLLTPWQIFEIKKICIKKLVTSDKFRGKVLSHSGVDMLQPRSSQDLRNHIWYKLETSISTSWIKKPNWVSTGKFRVFVSSNGIKIRDDTK